MEVIVDTSDAETALLRSILNKQHICATGVNSTEERSLTSLIKELGGKLSSELDTGETLCLLVRKVGSDKHKAAQRHNIPAVEVEWLRDCKREKQRLSFDSYSVRPFLGLSISCTGYNAEVRFMIQKTVEENGGEFMATMVKEKCTHLIAEEVGEGKYAHAKSWGTVHIVTKQWLDDCHRKKTWLAEYNYLVGMKGVASSSSTSSATIVNGSHIDSHNASILPDLNTKSVVMVPAATTSFYASADHAAETALNTGTGRSRLTAASSSSSSSSSSSAVALPAPAASALTVADLPSPELLSAAGVDCGNLLQGEVFFLAGFAPDMRDYIVRLVLRGGGQRHHVLTLEVTKVFLGIHAEDRLIAEVRRHPCGAKCVPLSWLIKKLFSPLIPPQRSEDGGGVSSSRLSIHRDVNNDVDVPLRRCLPAMEAPIIPAAAPAPATTTLPPDAVAASSSARHATAMADQRTRMSATPSADEENVHSMVPPPTNALHAASISCSSQGHTNNNTAVTDNNTDTGMSGGSNSKSSASSKRKRPLSVCTNGQTSSQQLVDENATTTNNNTNTNVIGLRQAISSSSSSKPKLLSQEQRQDNAGRATVVLVRTGIDEYEGEPPHQQLSPFANTMPPPAFTIGTGHKKSPTRLSQRRVHAAAAAAAAATVNGDSSLTGGGDVGRLPTVAATSAGVSGGENTAIKRRRSLHQRPPPPPAAAIPTRTNVRRGSSTGGGKPRSQASYEEESQMVHYNSFL